MKWIDLSIKSTKDKNKNNNNNKKKQNLDVCNKVQENPNKQMTY